MRSWGETSTLAGVVIAGAGLIILTYGLSSWDRRVSWVGAALLLIGVQIIEMGLLLTILAHVQDLEQVPEPSLPV